MTKSKKSSCPFCKDEKNQPLKAYLLRRSREKKNSKICEEDEELAEEEEQKCCTSGKNHTQQKKWNTYNSTNADPNLLGTHPVGCIIINTF